MAKTMYSISLNYNKAQQQAKNLDSIASQLRGSASKLQGCKGNISSAWKGENATAYLKKLEMVANNLDKIEKNINKIASTVRANSKRIYDAEVNALNIAKKRNYK